MDRGRDGHQGTRISLVRKRASLIRRGVGVDESFAPGASLKDLSAEEYARLSTLWDESIEMAPEQLDAWLAALVRSEPKLAALLRVLCTSQEESRERRFLETSDLVARHVAALVESLRNRPGPPSPGLARMPMSAVAGRARLFL